ncbi:putative ankyrin repeat protein PA3287 [Schistocerca serialis cubense]|uniref:putative ankyrin repeat protein PA3287 n=1 Tax=Schistocerca serialis cubense TaxID=2023355 RepID=UPI00214E123D|nr:putative ankyrin repeat protein PA3287 [Schistocerca serialis cubense]
MGAVGGMRIVGAVGGMGGVWGAAPGTDPHPDAFLPDFAPTPKLTRLAKESRKLPGSLSVEERGWRLLLAADDGAVGELRALIAAGADVASRGWGGQTALHWAAYRGDVEAVRLLVGAGAAADARSDAGWTPLHWAAFNGHAEVAAALLVAGADRGATTVGGQTALDLARQWNRWRLVEMLS